MSSQIVKPARAAIWAARILDLALAIVFVVLLHAMLACAGVYLPIEISVLALLVLASGLQVGLFGRTIGQRACGIEVIARKGGGRPGIVRSILRPIVGRQIAGLQLIAPAIADYHRRIARTVLCITALCIAAETIALTRVYRRGHSFDADAALKAGQTTSADRAATRTDVRSLDAAGEEQLARWLAANAVDPAEYAIRIAAAHEVTLLGEMHDLRDNLAFFNQILPDLYARAGVRVVCLECCSPDQDADLDRLVRGKEFDRALQLKIARNASWPCWGFRGYWDVLETVWRMNVSRPAGSPPMRVVGIIPRVDLVSLLMFKGGPPIERLRADRLLWNIVPLAAHEGLYASAVERATFARHERGVVWVGAAHTPLVHRAPIRMGEKLAGESPRMGNLLYARYGDRVASITLHYAETRPAIAKTIERAVAASGRTSAGFDVIGSPFALLRDGECADYSYQPDACLTDISPGYIFLRPANEMTRCDWMDDYVSTYMFGCNRPFYEMIANRKFSTAGEFNAFASANAIRF